MLDPVSELLLDEAGLGSAAVAQPVDAPILVLDDPALANHLAAAGRSVLAYCDDLRDERELELAALTSLDADSLAGVGVVLLRLPKSLGMLQDYAERVAAWAPPEVRLLAGGREKHLSRGMNDVLGASFGQVEASLGRRKARVLRAARPIQRPLGWPRTDEVAEVGLSVVSYAGVFAAGRLDGGTRLLLSALDTSLPILDLGGMGDRPQPAPPGNAAAAGLDSSEGGATAALRTLGRAADLGCGTGILSAWLARRGYNVQAIDVSRAACASTSATAKANGLAVEVHQAEDLVHLAAGPIDLVVINPPFHRGTAKDSTPGFDLIRSVLPALSPSAELWTVFNSHLPYLPFLRAEVGPTRVNARDRHYTVTCTSYPRRPPGRQLPAAQRL